MLSLGRSAPLVGRRALVAPRRHCGILAILAPDAAAAADGRLAESAVRARTSRLQHRGPDGQGFAAGGWRAGGGLGEGGGWALGHQRLAIVDPDSSAADQPFYLAADAASPATGDAASSIALVANGEIYNHHAILSRCEAAAGYDLSRVQSGSDCEAIAHAYTALGADAAVRSLDGMFAFVLIDEVRSVGTTRGRSRRG